ncbi:hypothetical protein D3C85_1803150 [compost metagenome]
MFPADVAEKKADFHKSVLIFLILHKSASLITLNLREISSAYTKNLYFAQILNHAYKEIIDYWIGLA